MTRLISALLLSGALLASGLPVWAADEGASPDAASAQPVPSGLARTGGKAKKVEAGPAGETADAPPSLKDQPGDQGEAVEDGRLPPSIQTDLLKGGKEDEDKGTGTEGGPLEGEDGKPVVGGGAANYRIPLPPDLPKRLRDAQAARQAQTPPPSPAARQQQQEAPASTPAEANPLRQLGPAMLFGHH